MLGYWKGGGVWVVIRGSCKQLQGGRSAGEGGGLNIAVAKWGLSTYPVNTK